MEDIPRDLRLPDHEKKREEYAERYPHEARQPRDEDAHAASPSAHFHVVAVAQRHTYTPAMCHRPVIRLSLRSIRPIE
jgi:hypothetical protein